MEWEPPIGRLPFRSALRVAPAVVAHELRQRLSPARQHAEDRIRPGRRMADRDERTRRSVGWDVQDPLRLGVLRVAPEPRDARAGQRFALPQPSWLTISDSGFRPPFRGFGRGSLTDVGRPTVTSDRAARSAGIPRIFFAAA